LLIEAARRGFEPHMHADGDFARYARLGRVGRCGGHFGRESVPPFSTMRSSTGDPALPAAERDSRPVFQWEKQARDTMEGAREYLGPARFNYIEPAGFSAARSTHRLRHDFGRWGSLDDCLP